MSLAEFRQSACRSAAVPLETVVQLVPLNFTIVPPTPTAQTSVALTGHTASRPFVVPTPLTSDHAVPL